MEKCNDIFKFAVDYMNRSLPQEVLRELDRHIRGCEKCRNFLKSYEETKEVSGELLRRGMPAELRRLLSRYIMEKARAFLDREKPGKG